MIETIPPDVIVALLLLSATFGAMLWIFTHATNTWEGDGDEPWS